MRVVSFLIVALLAPLGTFVHADIPDIAEKSPDGKWLFKAHWREGSPYGYLWDLQNTATGKTYFTQTTFMENEALPQRLNVLWSKDSHYLAINFYYGRLLYGINMVALLSDVPKEDLQWPAPTEKSMIKPEDLKNWGGGGELNCSTDSSQPGNILVLNYDFRSDLTDKAPGKVFRINSFRTQSIQFTGMKGKVVDSTPPEYEKAPE